MSMSSFAEACARIARSDWVHQDTEIQTKQLADMQMHLNRLASQLTARKSLLFLSKKYANKLAAIRSNIADAHILSEFNQLLLRWQTVVETLRRQTDRPHYSMQDHMLLYGPINNPPSNPNMTVSAATSAGDDTRQLAVIAQMKNAREIAQGVWLVDNFMQRYLHHDPVELHETLLKTIPMYEEDEQLQKGLLKFVPGGHPALRYRGNAIRRAKVWVQTNALEDGRSRYLYTGWQWSILDATAHVSDAPLLADIMQKMSSIHPFNHGIYTSYATLEDNIGQHQDKTHDIAPHTLIVVLRTGSCARNWLITNAEDDSVVFQENVRPGAAIFMSQEANQRYKHGVPVMDNASEVDQRSGSFVMRDIKTLYSDAYVHNKQQVAKKQQQKRRLDRETRDTKPAKKAKMQ